MLLVRVISSDDWPEWRRLRREALRESPDAFDSVLADWSGPGDTEQRWRNRLNAVSLNLVADLDGVAVGMISRTEVVNQKAELISMWVAPEARRRGVGEALIRAVVDHARDDGAVTVVLDVNLENRQAIALYERCGFVDGGWATNQARQPQRRRMQLQIVTERS
ncbi:MAG: GNAT family N-acetyltransferase [Actinomycetes bacterium]